MKYFGPYQYINRHQAEIEWNEKRKVLVKFNEPQILGWEEMDRVTADQAGVFREPTHYLLAVKHPPQVMGNPIPPAGGDLLPAPGTRKCHAVTFVLSARKLRDYMKSMGPGFEKEVKVLSEIAEALEDMEKREEYAFCQGMAAGKAEATRAGGASEYVKAYQKGYKQGERDNAPSEIPSPHTAAKRDTNHIFDTAAMTRVWEAIHKKRYENQSPYVRTELDAREEALYDALTKRLTRIANDHATSQPHPG